MNRDDEEQTFVLEGSENVDCQIFECNTVLENEDSEASDDDNTPPGNQLIKPKDNYNNDESSDEDSDSAQGDEE